jgi:branched-chain amino acid transport system substrate-binding protein
VKARTAWLVSLLAIASVVVAGCGGSTSAAADHSPLVIALFTPFTGPDAQFGVSLTAGCNSGAKAVNDAGGVMGRQIQCVAVDTRGDPADAVPAARKLIATTPNLVLVMGCTSDESSATVPIFNTAKIPMFCNTGEPAFDRTSNTYFHRLVPADDYAGYAMAVWAHKQGVTRAAAVFGNDIGSQGTLPTLQTGFQKAGGTITISQSIPLDQSSYRTEVQQMIATNPQAMFTEADPQTCATYLSQLKQLHGLIPIIGADPTLDPAFWKAVGGAIGTQALTDNFVAENPTTSSSGPGYDAFKAAVLSAPGLTNPQQWVTQPFVEHEFDAVIIASLAMTMAKSIDGSVYNSFIQKVTSGGAPSGATEVNTYASGQQNLNSGKSIIYVGVGGATHFDQWGNSPGDFEVDHYDPQGNIVSVGSVTAAEVASLMNG